MHKDISIYIHVTTVNKKEDLNFKKTKKEYIGRFGERKGKREIT